MQAPPSPPRPHLRHVEGMRALAALVVLFNHGYAQIWALRSEGPPPLFAPLDYLMVLGHLSVSVFIVISGFCLMLPVLRGPLELRGGAPMFFFRRARRILPPYYGAVALSLVLIWLAIGEPTGTLWDVSLAYRRSDLVSHLLLLQDVFGTGKINYAFWSIATEWQIYFFFPLLVLAWRRWGPRVVVPFALLVSYAISAAVLHTRLGRASVHYFGLFALGMLAAAIALRQEPVYQRLRARLPWAALAAACAAVAAALTLHWGRAEATRRFIILDGPVGIVAVCLLVLSTRSERNPVRSFFSLRPLAWIGAFSYSLYLIHAPLLQLFWQYAVRPLGLSTPLQFGMVVLAGMPLIVIAAWLFYLVLERPFLGAPATQKVQILVPSP